MVCSEGLSQRSNISSMAKSACMEEDWKEAACKHVSLHRPGPRVLVQKQIRLALQTQI